jgi:isoleucyl-tRNA synthetase
MAGDQAINVILDIRLTPTLVEEGQVRDLIRTIQDASKKMNLPVEKYISVSFSASNNS